MQSGSNIVESPGLVGRQRIQKCVDTVGPFCYSNCLAACAEGPTGKSLTPAWAGPKWSKYDATSGGRMNRSRFPAALILACLGAFLIAGCGGGGASITVEISPSAAQTMDSGQSMNFTAFLANDNLNRGVTWTATGSSCSGNGCGTLTNVTTTSVTYVAPTISAALTVTLKATSVANSSSTASVTINIVLAPSFTATGATTSLPNGANGMPYSQTIVVIGGVPPLTFTLTPKSGSLPACLNLNKTGTLVGTPCGSGTSNFRVTATDNGTPPLSTVSPLFTISITPAPPLSFTRLSSTGTTPLPDGFINVVYNTPIATSGGVTPFSWTITAGSLPEGLGMDPISGQITGTSTALGTSTFTVQVQDSTLPRNQVISAQFSLTIQSAKPLQIMTTSLPSGQTATGYSSSLQATGGVQPYTWSLISGQLPSGLTLGSNGTISGVPVLVTTSPDQFTVQVTDSEVPPATTTQPLSLSITAGTTSSNTLVSGQYAFLFRGFDCGCTPPSKGTTGAPVEITGTISADGKGNITGGGEDINRFDTSANASTILVNATLTGSYSIGTDGRGTMELIATNPLGTGVTLTTDYRLVVQSNGNIEFFEDDSTTTNTDTYRTHGEGIMKPVLSSSFSAASLSGNYAFEFSGRDFTGNPTAVAGVIFADGNGNLKLPSGAPNGDFNDGGTFSPQLSFTGNYSFISGDKGQGNLTYQLPLKSQVTINFTFYFISNNDLFLQEIDVTSTTNPLPRLSGELILQPSTVPFDTTSLTGTSVATGTGLNSSGNASVFAGLLVSPGDGTTSLAYDENNGGAISPPTAETLPGTYTVGTNGRVNFCWQAEPQCANLGARVAVAYLTGPGQAFLLGADTEVTTGLLEQQTAGLSFSDSSVQGGYTLSALFPAEKQVNNVIGQVNSDGTGSLTGTLDEFGATGTPNFDQSLNGTQINTIAADGRGTITTNLPQGFPARLVFYIVSPSSVRLISVDPGDQHPEVFFFDH